MAVEIAHSTERLSEVQQKGASRWRSTSAMVWFSLLLYCLLAVFLFALAGRWDLPWYWAALVAFSLSHMAMIWTVFRVDSELVKERLAPGPGTPTWDTVILSMSGVLILCNLIVAPLDVGRFHWSPRMNPMLRLTGVAGIVLGMAIMSWAMKVNTYFSKVVRIQHDRGHKVIRSGPYRYVRHPGYVGWIVLWISLNLSLGSWLAMQMSAAAVVVILVRTSWEDDLLCLELNGYDAYAQEVRWRLIPWLW